MVPVEGLFREKGDFALKSGYFERRIGLPRFHMKSGQPLKPAVFAGKGQLRNPEVLVKS